MTIGAWKNRRTLACPWLISQLIIIFLPVIVGAKIGLISVALQHANMDEQTVHLIGIFFFFYQLLCWTLALLYHIEIVSVESCNVYAQPSYMSL